MTLPDFYTQVPGIRLRDSLAELLGAAQDGVIEYSYADAVKLTGHSCPTVASAYALTRRALNALYPDPLTLPERGRLRVEFASLPSDGVAGVTASVVSMITGAAADGGFKGLAGQHVRRNLLKFGADLSLSPRIDFRLTRLDTGTSADAYADLSAVPLAAGISELMSLCLAHQASDEERQAFASAWQDRVRHLLTEHIDDPSTFSINLSTHRSRTAAPASTA